MRALCALTEVTPTVLLETSVLGMAFGLAALHYELEIIRLIRRLSWSSTIYGRPILFFQNRGAVRLEKSEKVQSNDGLHPIARFMLGHV